MIENEEKHFEEIAEILSIPDDEKGMEVINTVFKECQNLIDSEENHQQTVEQKAMGLIQISGISTSLLATVGANIIMKIENVPPPFFGCPLPWLVSFWILSLITAVVSLIISILVLRVRGDYRSSNPDDLFSIELENGPGAYKRYLSLHFYKVFLNNRAINERKALLLKHGQKIIIFSMVAIIAFSLILCYYFLERGF